MKVQCTALLFLAAQAAAFITDDPDMVDDCMDCLEDLDDARDCLRKCNEIAYDPDGDGTGTLEDNGSLLNYCLDPDSGDSVDDIEELVDCCQMDPDCEDEFEDAQECIEECFPPCISESAKEYIDCINDEDRGIDSSKCSRQICIDSFTEDLEDEVDVSGDLLDIENLADRLESLDEDQVGDCENLEEFVDAVCELGEDCCERCNEDLATLVDCMINEVVIPYVAWETNTTIDLCPIDIDQCELEGSRRRERKNRALSQEEQELFGRALALPKSSQTKRDPSKEAKIKDAEKRRVLQTSDEAITACKDKMNLDTVMYNISYATTEYMACVTAAGIAALPDEEESSAASAAWKLAALVVGSAFAFL